MKKAFTVELYVKVSRDLFKISSVSDPSREQVFTPSEAFTTQRLLVGQFSIAERCLKDAISSMVGKSLIPKSVRVVVHPEEMVDGGLSEIEARLFKELCLSAGARKVAVWVGNPLSTRDLAKLLENA
ncbi:hypothetical protein SAMN04488490_2173 [Marinobacter sp. LV10R510-11A]|uniref:hypothetical protein n=1 Tax=Marinobacter sp. LV10R510-11A TaxID=1415568 RepID=UPI000BB9B574|nr:hypothetical protein [Marinobacter sp. LV10R510-11A]SOB76481.1 hypothetical protein SAMN04488490_2173 [Marinobacter sp. LV10R510-11A]